MRKPSDLTSAHAVIAVIGARDHRDRGRSSWAGEGLVPPSTGRGYSTRRDRRARLRAGRPQGLRARDDRQRRGRAPTGPPTAARTRGVVTLDCDSRDSLARRSRDVVSSVAGRLVAQDRIYPIAACDAAEGTVVYAEHGGEPWMIGRCTCNDITVTFEVPVALASQN